MSFFFFLKFVIITCDAFLCNVRVLLIIAVTVSAPTSFVFILKQEVKEDTVYIQFFEAF